MPVIRWHVEAKGRAKRRRDAAGTARKLRERKLDGLHKMCWWRYCCSYDDNTGYYFERPMPGRSYAKVCPGSLLTTHAATLASTKYLLYKFAFLGLVHRDRSSLAFLTTRSSLLPALPSIICLLQYALSGWKRREICVVHDARQHNCPGGKTKES
jgi:hypothetical protein